MIAIILAGGKSSRMRSTVAAGEREKALIAIGAPGRERRLIDLVVASVQNSAVEDFFVAVTKNTPRTASYCRNKGYETIETPGDGYVEDLWYLLTCYPEFVSVVCDIPFVKCEHIDAIIGAYREHRVSITGAVPFDLLPPGLTPSHVFDYGGKQLISCGINVVTNSPDSMPFVFDEPLLAINVNTDQELRVARSLLERRENTECGFT
jgi:adenosylcobinamide-phosphate guanylyltransferase